VNANPARICILLHFSKTKHIFPVSSGNRGHKPSPDHQRRVVAGQVRGSEYVSGPPDDQLPAERARVRALVRRHVAALLRQLNARPGSAVWIILRKLFGTVFLQMPLVLDIPFLPVSLRKTPLVSVTRPIFFVDSRMSSVFIDSFRHPGSAVWIILRK